MVRLKRGWKVVQLKYNFERKEETLISIFSELELEYKKFKVTHRTGFNGPLAVFDIHSDAINFEMTMPVASRIRRCLYKESKSNRLWLHIPRAPDNMSRHINRNVPQGTIFADWVMLVS